MKVDKLKLAEEALQALGRSLDVYLEVFNQFKGEGGSDSTINTPMKPPIEFYDFKKRGIVNIGKTNGGYRITLTKKGKKLYIEYAESN